MANMLLGHQEVDCLIKSGDSLPPLPSLNSFKGALVDGLRWLRQALMVIPDSCNSRNPKLKDVKEVLEEAQVCIQASAFRNHCDTHYNGCHCIQMKFSGL